MKLFRYMILKTVVVGSALSMNANAGIHSGIRELYSGSSSHETCVLMADKRAYCWGQTPGASALNLLGKDIGSMVLGDAFRCAITADHEMWCWGHGPNGELGDGTTDSRDVPKPVQYGGANFDRVYGGSAGVSHACAIRDTAVYCWGDNSASQIGNFMLPSSSKALTPTAVLVHDSITNPPLSGVREISAGAGHNCALLNDNTGACWGENDVGQVGNARIGGNYNSPQTVLVDSGGLQPLVMGGSRVAAGGYASCGLVTDKILNSVGCWGRNIEGELAIGDNRNRYTAFPATDERGKIVDALDLAPGAFATCIIIADLTVRCWGYDGDLQLGVAAGGSDKNRGVVLLASRGGDAFTGAIRIVAGERHLCVRKLLDDIYCWGDNGFGQIGSNVGARTDIPTKVAIDAPIFYDNFQND